MTASGAAEPDLYHFIFAPPAGAKAPPRKSAAAAPRLTVFPDTGEVSALRAAKGIGVTHLHLSCGPILATHYHEDRGSFVLEAAGEPLAIDRGVTTYDHPEVALIGDANRHNLIYPESPDGALVHQPPSAAGGRLGSALSVETEAGAAVLLACDTAAAWEPGVFRANIRRVFSPSADLFLFDDEVELGRAIPVSFRLNTRGAVEERDGETWILGRAAELRVVPLNWTPARNVAGIEGVDSHLEPVILVKLMTGAARSHRLLTAVQVVPAGGSAAWQFERGPAVACTNGILEARLTASEPLALRAQVRSRGRRLYTATCAMARWKVARA
jgi:hypothetical protein